MTVHSAFQKLFHTTYSNVNTDNSSNFFTYEVYCFHKWYIREYGRYVKRYHGFIVNTHLLSFQQIQRCLLRCASPIEYVGDESLTKHLAIGWYGESNTSITGRSAEPFS
ncbi:unnamed protein product [Trichobilharzia szidati]|nr:unnamed protein product [Trichobilharzia szidati]